MTFVGRTAARYARALWALASAQGQAQQVYANLRLVAEVLDATPDLVQLLGHTRLRMPQRLELLDKVLAAIAAPSADGTDVAVQWDALSLDFLRLLVQRERIGLLDQVLADVAARLDVEHQVVRARVTTAVPLHDAERERLRTALEKRTGAQRVELEEVVDAALVAGMLVHFQGQVIDSTVATWLETLRERLRQVKVGEFIAAGWMGNLPDVAGAAAGPETVR